MRRRSCLLLLMISAIAGVIACSYLYLGEGGGDSQDTVAVDHEYADDNSTTENTATLKPVPPAAVNETDVSTRFSEHIKFMKDGLRNTGANLSDERFESYRLWLDQIEDIDDHNLRQQAEQGSPRALALLFYYYSNEGNRELAEYYGKRLLPLLPLTERGLVAMRVYEALAAEHRFDEAAAYVCYANMISGRDALGAIGNDFWAEQAANTVAVNYPDVEPQVFDLDSVANECHQLASSIDDETMATVGRQPFDLFWAITAEFAADVIDGDSAG